MANSRQLFQEPCAQAGNEADHSIYDIPDIHANIDIPDIHAINDIPDIYDIPDIKKIPEIHAMHDNCDINEIGNIDHTPNFSKEEGIFLCVKNLPQSEVPCEDNRLVLGKSLVSVSRRRRSSSLNSIDLETTHIVSVDVHDSNI